MYTYVCMYVRARMIFSFHFYMFWAQISRFSWQAPHTTPSPFRAKCLGLGCRSRNRVCLAFTRGTVVTGPCVSGLKPSLQWAILFCCKPSHVPERLE